MRSKPLSSPLLPFSVTQDPNPITVRIGYEWPKEQQQGNKKSKDTLWPFLKDDFESIFNSVEKASKKRHGATAFEYRLSRMRAKHGAELCSRFMELCKQSDILAFDITSRNPNVMFELGLAIAMKGLNSGRVFLFEEERDDWKIPSDLAGYFVTYYRKGKSGDCLQIKDLKGFNAALRTVVTADARDRGMWGIKSEIIED